jgi:hypothetical protein
MKQPGVTTIVHILGLNPFLFFSPLFFFGRFLPSLSLFALWPVGLYVPRSYGCDGTLIFKSSGLRAVAWDNNKNGDTFRQLLPSSFFTGVVVGVVGLAEFQ